MNYSVTKPGYLKIEVFSENGEFIENIINEYKSEGYYQVTWDGKNYNEQSVSTGIYLFYIRFDNSVVIRKVVYLE